MNKTQLVDEVATRIGDKRAAAAAVDALVDTITTTVASGEKVAINGFGSFERVQRAERAFHNPATGERGVVPATYVPKFRVGAAFRAGVKKTV